jgi:hypothetical protein
MFNPKQEIKNEVPIVETKNYPLTTPNTGGGKERARITSSNWNTSLQNVQGKSSGNINSNTGSTGATILSNMNAPKTELFINREGNSSPLNSPDRRRTSIGGFSQAQSDAVTTSRQFCIYYNFFCT